MKYFVFLIAFCLFSGCVKKESGEQIGTAAKSALEEVIDSKSGYIIENARFADPDEKPAFTIASKFHLITSTSVVLIIRQNYTELGFETILALQFPVFALGTTIDFSSDSPNAQFWIIDKQKDLLSTRKTGMIAGSVRLINKSTSPRNLGLNRQLLNGIGDIEITVTNIDSGNLKIDQRMDYNARFQLPIFRLDEMIEISRPT